MSERIMLATVNANIELLISKHRNEYSSHKYVVQFGVGEK